MTRQLKLNSPAGSTSMIFDWPLINTKYRNQAQEIIDTISFVCLDFVELRPAMNYNIAQYYQPDNYESMAMMCEKYNRAIDGIRQLWKGRQPPKCFGARPSNKLLEHVMHMIYSTAIMNPEKLNNYEPFSPEVYGETSFSLMAQILDILKPTSQDIFIDLGSGVGQAVLQTAASTQCKECWGIEKADVPAKFAEEMDKNFQIWMKWFGKSYAKYHLLKGDFLASEYKELISKSTLIFVNNFAFGPSVDHQLKEKFANLIEGARIVSSKEFMPLNFRISSRNLSDIGSIMRIEELASLKGGVSWTEKPVKYFLHTLDSTALTKYYDRGKDQKDDTMEDAVDHDAKAIVSNETNENTKKVDDVQKSIDSIDRNAFLENKNIPNKLLESSFKNLFLAKESVCSQQGVNKSNTKKENNLTLKPKSGKVKSSSDEIEVNDKSKTSPNKNKKIIVKKKYINKGVKSTSMAANSLNGPFSVASLTQQISIKSKDTKERRTKCKQLNGMKRIAKIHGVSYTTTNTNGEIIVTAEKSSHGSNKKKTSRNVNDAEKSRVSSRFCSASMNDAQINQSNLESHYKYGVSDSVRKSTEKNDMMAQLPLNNDGYFRERQAALATFNQLLISFAQDMALPEFHLQLKNEYELQMQRQNELSEYVRWLESENQRLLHRLLSLLKKSLKAVNISNPDDVKTWYPDAVTQAPLLYSKNLAGICHLNDELTELEEDSLRKFSDIKDALGEKVGSLSQFSLNEVKKLCYRSTDINYNREKHDCDRMRECNDERFLDQAKSSQLATDSSRNVELKQSTTINTPLLTNDLRSYPELCVTSPPKDKTKITNTVKSTKQSYTDLANPITTTSSDSHFSSQEMACETNCNPITSDNVSKDVVNSDKVITSPGCAENIENNDAINFQLCGVSNDCYLSKPTARETCCTTTTATLADSTLRTVLNGDNTTCSVTENTEDTSTPSTQCCSIVEDKLSPNQRNVFTVPITTVATTFDDITSKADLSKELTNTKSDITENTKNNHFSIQTYNNSNNTENFEHDIYALSRPGPIDKLINYTNAAKSESTYDTMNMNRDVTTSESRAIEIDEKLIVGKRKCSFARTNGKDSKRIKFDSIKTNGLHSKLLSKKIKFKCSGITMYGTLQKYLQKNSLHLHSHRKVAPTL